MQINFLCARVCVRLCRHQAALRTALRTTQVVFHRKKKVAILNLHFKAVTDKISNYLRAEQDILEVCNCNEREGIPSLHSRGAACFCAMLRTQKRRVGFRFFVSPLHSALGNHKLPVPLCRRVLCCWGLQPKVVFLGLGCVEAHSGLMLVRGHGSSWFVHKHQEKHSKRLY